MSESQIVISEKIGFIFDLDGTLIDDIPFFVNLPHELAKIYGIEITDEELEELEAKILDGLTQEGGKSLFLKLLIGLSKDFGIPWYKRMNFLKRIYKVYKENLPNIPLFKNAEKTLELLKNNYNCVLGMVTSSSLKEIHEKCDKFNGFLDMFDGNLIGRNTVKRMKPSPEGILMLSKKWGILPRNLVMVGDMEVDIIAGKKAGATTIGVLKGFSTQDRMKNYAPDFILEDISQIPGNLPKILNYLAKKN